MCRDGFAKHQASGVLISGVSMLPTWSNLNGRLLSKPDPKPLSQSAPTYRG